MFNILIKWVIQDDKTINIKCNDETQTYNLSNLKNDENKAPKYYDICADKIYNEGCEQQQLISMQTVDNDLMQLCINLQTNIQDTEFQEQGSTTVVCADTCTQYYYVQGNVKTCLSNCDNGYQYIYNQNKELGCTNDKNCIINNDKSKAPFLIITNATCVSKCDYYSFDYNSIVKACTAEQNCNDKNEKGEQMNYLAGSTCTINCSNYYYKYNEQIQQCVSSCDNQKTQEGKELGYIDTSIKQCVEQCTYNWFYSQSGTSNKQCTTGMNCPTSQESHGVSLTLLNTTNKQCIQSCKSETYKYYYYYNIEDNILKACTKYNNCSEAFAYDNTEMSKLDLIAGICKEKCDYDWWYYQTNNSIVICTSEPNNECVNLIHNNLQYTSVNVEDKQCTIKATCINNSTVYVLDDERCYYYKSFTRCNQYSETNFSKYVVQSKQSKLCVESCDEQDYFYINYDQEEQKICVASCDQTQGYTKIDEEQKQCLIPESNDGDQDKPTEEKGNNTGMIIGISIAAVVLIVVIILASLFICKKKKVQQQVIYIDNKDQQQVVATQKGNYI